MVGQAKISLYTVRCNGKTACRINGKSFQDPCFGTDKYGQVDYVCQSQGEEIDSIFCYLFIYIDCIGRPIQGTVC